MTLAQIQAMMVKHLGVYSNDADNPDVLAQYMPEALVYINQAYGIVMKRYAGDRAVYNPLNRDDDQPVFLPASEHGILAEYAAGKILLSEPGRVERATALLGAFADGLTRIPWHMKMKFVNRYEPGRDDEGGWK